MSKRITYVNFHQGLFVPGLGNIGNTLPSQSKHFDLSMRAAVEGVDIAISYGSTQKNVLVPWPNVVLATYEEDPTPATENKLPKPKAA